MRVHYVSDSLHRSHSNSQILDSLSHSNLEESALYSTWFIFLIPGANFQILQNVYLNSSVSVLYTIYSKDLHFLSKSGWFDRFWKFAKPSFNTYCLKLTFSFCSLSKTNSARTRTKKSTTPFKLSTNTFFTWRLSCVYWRMRSAIERGEWKIKLLLAQNKYYI